MTSYKVPTISILYCYPPLSHIHSKTPTPTSPFSQPLSVDTLKEPDNDTFVIFLWRLTFALVSTVSPARGMQSLLSAVYSLKILATSQQTRTLFSEYVFIWCKTFPAKVSSYTGYICKWAKNLLIPYLRTFQEWAINSKAGHNHC